MKRSLLALALSVCALANAAPINATLVVEAGKSGPRIDPNIYGQFVEHLGRGVHEDIWVGGVPISSNVRGIPAATWWQRSSASGAVIRWPGGCFAELYHWRDGIGPRAAATRGINRAWGDEPGPMASARTGSWTWSEQIGARLSCPSTSPAARPPRPKVGCTT